jgi:hypothetical protein
VVGNLDTTPLTVILSRLRVIQEQSGNNALEGDR